MPQQISVSEHAKNRITLNEDDLYLIETNDGKLRTGAELDMGKWWITWEQFVDGVWESGYVYDPDTAKIAHPENRDAAKKLADETIAKIAGIWNLS